MKTEKDTMTLNVRNVPRTIGQALRERAAANNRSAEAEHREILKQALSGTERVPLSTVLMNIPSVGDDSDFERHDEDGQRNVLG